MESSTFERKTGGMGPEELFVKSVMEGREGYVGNYTVWEKHKFLSGSTCHYCIPMDLPALPATVRGVIQEIYRSDQVVDHSDKPNNLTCSVPGSMRSWYQNQGYWLPAIEFDEAALTGKPEKLHAYIVENKGLQNKQAKKGIKQVYKGYVEYTPCNSFENQWARIVYDYIHDLVYFSPSHYTPFTMEESTEGFFPKITDVVIHSEWERNQPKGLYNPFLLVRSK
jgi:hypothetical protein